MYTQQRESTNSRDDKDLKSFEKIPSTDEANFLLFSMHGIEGINHFLTKFPRWRNNLTGENTQEKGCSATVVWTGKKGFNVPVETFQPVNRTTGFVLDPSKIEIPQADIIAKGSFGTVQDEVKKEKSKYPNKKGYYRLFFFMSIFPVKTIFATNLARHEHLPGKKESIYHSEGTVRVFAKNIWRKARKNPKKYITQGVMCLNEALVYQKKDENPVTGLFITKTPSSRIATKLLKIMQHNCFDLYLYNKRSEIHAVRYLDNKAAQAYLVNPSLFEEKFSQAKPFMGPLLFSQKKRKIDRCIEELSIEIEEKLINENNAKKLEQESSPSCCIWLKIVIGIALLGGSAALLIFFPHLVATSLSLKFALGVTSTIGIGLFSHGYYQLDTREPRNEILVRRNPFSSISLAQ